MKKNTGYTLIEVLIVITILGIIMPAVFSILFAILQQQAKISEITEVKRQGDSVLQFMKEKISREAEGVVDTSGVTLCDNPAQDISTAEGEDFIFEGSSNFSFHTNADDELIFTQGILTTQLSASPIIIKNFQISCVKKSTYSSPIVAFSYIVEFNRASPDLQLGTTELFYQSRVRLRTGDSN